MPGSEADKLVVLVQCDTEWHAESIAAGLRGRGIAAEAEGGYVAGWRADTPARSRVLVFTKDLLSARLLLSELKAGSGSIDWDTVDVGEIIEGAPEPAGKIGPAPESEPNSAAARTRGVVVTVVFVIVAVLVLGLIKACGGQSR